MHPLAQRALVTAVLLSVVEAPARAETPAASVQVTESSSLLYNSNNRNTRRSNVTSVLDDNWALWYNRLFVQGRALGFRAELRLDSVYFPVSRSPTAAARQLVELEQTGKGEYSEEAGQLFVQKFYESGRERSTRFTNWIYPSKLRLSYHSPKLKITLGDFYAQFGRGMVLSVRKRDELSGDTTIRGVKATAKVDTHGLGLQVSALGGTLNPLRIDEASGRFLGTPQQPGGLATVTELAMPGAPTNDFTLNPQPNFGPDRIAGAQLKLRSTPLAASVHGALMSRWCLDEGQGCHTLSDDPVRGAAEIINGGISLDAPDVAGFGSLYAEAAMQRRGDYRGDRKSETGHTVYASAHAPFDGGSVTVEARHTRGFFPLRANIDIARAREFLPLQASTLPTTEPVWNDTQFEAFNNCVSGGRARADIKLAPRQSTFTWLGYHRTWGEIGDPGDCSPAADNLNRVWDVAQGASLHGRQTGIHADFMVGARFDSSERLLVGHDGSATHVFYREVYSRYDVQVPLNTEFSVQLQAWHRRRRLTLGGPPEPWLQGQTTTALQWGRELNLAFGFEYTENPAFPSTYFNGQLRYQLSGASNLNLFVGQRQGGLRCVSGVCRIFPPFEGARLDATWRF